MLLFYEFYLFNFKINGGHRFSILLIVYLKDYLSNFELPLIESYRVVKDKVTEPYGGGFIINVFIYIIFDCINK